MSERTYERWQAMQRARRRRALCEERFVCDADRDRYRCPAGKELRRGGRGTNRHGQLYTCYRTDACRGCALRAQCTTANQGRVIDRYDSDDYRKLSLFAPLVLDQAPIL